MRIWCLVYSMYLDASNYPFSICGACPKQEECREYNKQLLQAIDQGKAVLGFEYLLGDK